MSNWDWSEFQVKMTDIPPRPVLEKALALFGGFAGYAVELGCGGCADTVRLLDAGWNVYAVDGTSDGFEHAKTRMPSDKLARVEFKKAFFEDMEIPIADFIYSSYSVPFCKRDCFGALWDKIERAVNAGGRFAGHLFGEQDGWINYIDGITLLTKHEVVGLFRHFDIEHFDELCEDRLSANVEGIKRWHVFEIVAKKRG